MNFEGEGPVTQAQWQAARQAVFNQVKTLVLQNHIGRVMARGGWTINMVIHEGDTLAVRERAWRAFDLFCQVVGPENLVWWHGGMPAAMTSKIAQKKMAESRLRSTDDPFARAMCFDVASGSPKPPEVWENNAQDFLFVAGIKNNNGIWLHDRGPYPGIGPAPSYIRMALPVSWIEQQPLERNAAWLTAQFVELMQPVWCTAGWGIVPAVEERNISSSGGQQILYPYLTRFPGFDALGGLSMMNHHFYNAMHSVNWLNFVSDVLLDKMGGRQAVRAMAERSPLLAVGDVGNCLLVQAGALPLLGDTTVPGQALTAYGQAARLLKPIRVKGYWNNFVAPPPYGSDDKPAQLLACDAYLSRFDQH